jgi:hypothetical protein
MSGVRFSHRLPFTVSKLSWRLSSCMETYNNGRNKDASRAARRRWYYRHKAQAIAQSTVNRNRRDPILRQWLNDYKAKLGCSHCPETHPACLEFHHKDPANKELELSRAASNGWSIERLQQEIAKCEVLCANCHKKFHWECRSAARTVVSKTAYEGASPSTPAILELVQ